MSEASLILRDSRRLPGVNILFDGPGAVLDVGFPDAEGDRDDASIRGLARETWPWRPDLVVLKEMPEHLRGRKPGEATGLLKAEFLHLGAPRGIFLHADTELEAVRDALAWAREGDLVLLPVHAQRDEVLALMERLVVGGWKAGMELPEDSKTIEG